MHIAIIGTGRMGIAQARLARLNGDTIAFGIDTDSNARKFFETTFDIKCFSTISDANWNAVELVWVTVCDDQISEIARQLYSHIPSSCVVFHTSGLHTSQCLRQHLPYHPCASIHPLMSCPLKTLDDAACYETYRGVIHTLEGDEAALKIADILVARLNGQGVRITKEQKPLYHAAAVFASNYPVILLQMAVEIFEQCGFAHLDALAGARRLFSQSALSCQIAEPIEALTGPAKRRDLTTIQKHMEALADDSMHIEAYRTLLKATQRMIGWNPKT